MTPFEPRRLATLLLLGALAAGCGRSDPSAERSAVPPLAVRVVRAGGSPADALVLPARVTARDEVTLTARTAARLTALPVREGGRFRRGATLAAFEAPETRAALEGATAALAAATTARDVARRQEARMDSLVGARVAAVHELEGAQAERRAAEAAWAQARAQLDGLQSAVRLEAPFDGVVVRRHIDPGATVGPGQPLLDLRSAQGGEIVAAIPESELARLAAGRAEFQVGDGPWRPATLTRVDGMTDPATRSRVARFAPGPGERPEPGAFARVRLTAGAARSATSAPSAEMGALSVPSSALVTRGGLIGVYVVEDGRARLRWLRVGREEGGRIAVLAGLGRDEAVIVAPAGLADGRAVRIES